MEHFTTAEEMARNAGLPNGKAFRARLRSRHASIHSFGSWKVAIGSDKHRVMDAVLKAMMAAKA